jgi:Fe-S cluster assembly iron-binding protein IscA
MSAAAAILTDCQRRLERARGGGTWFSAGGGKVDHGTYRSVLAPYHDRVYHEGRVAWASLVLAQPGLFTPGDFDSTATVVYSYDRHFDANPQQLERVAASVGALKSAMPKDALLVSFAAEVRNETPREINALVPVALTAGRQVRYETLYVQRHRLPTGYLAGQFFPVIISVGQPTQPMLLPLDLWSPDLVAAWQEAMRKKPPAAAPARPIQQGYDAYVEAPPPPANPGLHFGAAAAANGAARGGRADRQGVAYGVDPYTHDPYTQEPYPEPGVPKAGGFASSTPPRPAPHAPPPPPPPEPVPVAAPLDPAEAFARNPVQLTAAAAGSLRFTAQQQSMNQFKVRVSAGDGAHRLDFVSGEPNPASDFVYDSAGVTLVVDVNSARSLTGVQVDFGPSPRGIGFSFRRVA